jgi:hypothetical protein
MSLRPVHPPHPHVEEDYQRLPRIQLGQCPNASMCRYDLVALLSQVLGQKRDHLDLIVHYEDLRIPHHGFFLPSVRRAELAYVASREDCQDTNSYEPICLAR